MRASHVVYEAPAVFDDLIEVFIRTKRIGTTSVTGECAAYRVEDDTLMCTAEQTMVLVEIGGRRPVPVPDEYRRAVAEFEGAALEAVG